MPGPTLSEDKGKRRQAFCGVAFWHLSRRRNLIRLVFSLVALIGADFASSLLSPRLLSSANWLGRRCLPHSSPHHPQHGRPRFRLAILTCSDNGHTIAQRPFTGLAELVHPNKQRYADRHGYDFIDASDVVDRSRPPSWSKILAIKRHLADFDWVFWTDADSLVTNENVRLDNLLDALILEAAKPPDVVSTLRDKSPDLIVTEDANGINAGMLFFRNSPWSMAFLERWWNQTAFVRPFGGTKSGDNDALIHLIATLAVEERHSHVHVAAMQCSFNSILWRPTLGNHHRIWTAPSRLWKGTYSRGDFMVHFAGLQDKMYHAIKMLREIDEERRT